MVDSGHLKLSIVRQCVLLNISRSSYEASSENLFNLLLMRMLDEQFLETPYQSYQSGLVRCYIPIW